MQIYINVHIRVRKLPKDFVAWTADREGDMLKYYHADAQVVMETQDSVTCKSCMDLLVTSGIFGSFLFSFIWSFYGHFFRRAPIYICIPVPFQT